MADHYRAVVASLERALERSDSEAALEARDLVRKLIETVVVTPLPERGKFALTVEGKIAALVDQDGKGLLPKNERPRLRDATDGLTHTIMYGESAGRPYLFRNGKQIGELATSRVNLSSPVTKIFRPPL